MSTGRLRLVIFDVDGTLVDSQADILAAMTRAFEKAGAEVPDRERILGIVGLSLPEAMARLAPDLSEALRGEMVDCYKSAYFELRAERGVAESSPLYPGAREALERLQAIPEVLLGVATGKSRRGLDKLIDGHGLQSLFVTQQVSDFHPSKPHPSMIHAALSETGVDPRDAVIVGDTSFDMEMGRAAGVHCVGVSWGYHDRAALTGADHVIDRFEDLPAVLDQIWEMVT